MTENLFREKSLFEIGFHLNDVQNWNKIVQPSKPNLMDLIEKMLKDHEKTNVKIRINDTTFNCHMIVLQCYSEFFSELNNEDLVILPSDKVTPKAFALIYEWMLSPKPVVKRDGILEVFSAAQFLKIKNLIDQCWVCLDDDQCFSEDASFLLYLEAKKFNLELLQELMLTRICKFFLTLVASKEFLELSSKELSMLLQSNSIGINSETDVLMAAARWLNCDWESRKDHIFEVLQCVRFGLMTPLQLIELRRNADSEEIQKVVNYPEIQKMIDDGLSFVTTKYWYSTDTESFNNFMERLNITEPIERQWVYDKTWSEKYGCSNQLYLSYHRFLDYLEVIRNTGRHHWKSLELRDESPNLLLKRYNSSPYDVVKRSNDIKQGSNNNDEKVL